MAQKRPNAPFGMMKEIAALFLIVLIAIILTLSLPNIPSQLGGNVDEFVSGLEASGFIVQEGRLSGIGPSAGNGEGLFPSTYYSNPSTPYVSFLLPDAPEQIFQSPFKGQDGMSPEFLLGENEAIVYIGKTPPNMTYFSYRLFLARRYSIEEGAYKPVFTSFEDTANSMRIRTQGSLNGFMGDPFNQTTVLVVAGSKNTQNAVMGALMNAGYSSSVINTEEIPSEKVKLGLGQGADTFAYLISLAFPDDEGAMENFIERPDARVFRITPGK